MRITNTCWNSNQSNHNSNDKMRRCIIDNDDVTYKNNKLRTLNDGINSMVHIILTNPPTIKHGDDRIFLTISVDDC